MSASHGGFYANIGGAAEPNIEGYIEEYEPTWVMLTEAYRARPFLKRLAKRLGYRLRQYGGRYGPEGNAIAILVKKRKGVRITYRSAMKMKRQWFGPFTGRRRAPRVHVRMTLKIDGTKHRFVFCFQPPGGPSGGVKTNGKNRPAWMEGRNKITRRANKKRKHISHIFGDENCLKDQFEWHFAARMDGKWDVASVGKVDHGASRGADLKGERVKNRGKGHGWGIYTIKEH